MILLLGSLVCRCNFVFYVDIILLEYFLFIQFYFSSDGENYWFYEKCWNPQTFQLDLDFGFLLLVDRFLIIRPSTVGETSSTSRIFTILKNASKQTIHF